MRLSAPWIGRFGCCVLLGLSLFVGQSDAQGPKPPKSPPPKQRPPGPGRETDPRVLDRRRPVSVERELLITDLAVIEHPVYTDPRKGDAAIWSFKYLIEQMAGGADPSEFAAAILPSILDRRVNGYDVPGRSLVAERVIEPWKKRSGGSRLDLAKAPVKLLAIVNRMDLRQIVDGNVFQAGEGRFIFGVLDEQGRPLQPLAGDAAGGMTIILEYSLPATDEATLVRWADDWHELGKYKPGTTDYDRRLARLTQRFTDRGRGGDRPNGSAINQIRTNEIALGSPWELREYHLDPTSGLPRLAPVAQTPDFFGTNDTRELADLLKSNARTILSGDFSLPPRLEGGAAVAGPFYDLRSDLPAATLAANLAIAEADAAAGVVSLEYLDSLTAFYAAGPKVVPLGDSGFADIPWQAPGVDGEVRHQFALNTCSGCHRLETGTAFLHVGFPESARGRDVVREGLGGRAALSAFLTGGAAVPDPVDPEIERKFADLGRRKLDLEGLLRRGPEKFCMPTRPH